MCDLHPVSIEVIHGVMSCYFSISRWQCWQIYTLTTPLLCYSLLPQSHTCMGAVVYLVSCFSHHLLASGPPNHRHGDDPVKVSGFQSVAATLKLTNELALEILEDVSNDINEVVPLAIACGDLHVPVY